MVACKTNNRSTKIYLWSFLLIDCLTNAANILGVFPINARSHFGFHEAMMKSLVDAGHRVTIISPFSPTKLDRNVTHIGSLVETNDDGTVSPFSHYDFKSMAWPSVVSICTDVCAHDCYDVMNLEKVKEILNSEEKLFDVMVIEVIPVHECFLPIAEKLGIPVIGTISARSIIWPDHNIGNPRHPLMVPFELSAIRSPMAFTERVLNLVHHVALELFNYVYITSVAEKFYERRFPLMNFQNRKKISLLFYNSHPSWRPRPYVPNSIGIGGIHVKLATMNPLPEDIEKFIDESESGVILFTLGSITRSNVIGFELRNVFRDAFAAIPQRVIWKFDDEIEGLSDNVLLMDWVPQKEILNHDNVKAFISHCGLSGAYESVHAGKPMIMLPVFGDQLSNAVILAEKEVGVHLDILSLTKDKLLDAINVVVNDTRYRRNMQKFSQIFRDDPVPLDRAVVYWTEYVVRHNGTSHLRTKDADMPTYQYLLLDVIGFVIAAAVTILCIVYYLCRKMYSFVFGRQRSKSLTKKEKKL